MSLKEGVDFIIVKHAGYDDGRATLKQMGDLIVTPNRFILNIIQTMDVMKELQGSEQATLKGDIEEFKHSTEMMTAYGKQEREVRRIADESDDCSEFEQKVMALSDHPKCVIFSKDDIKQLKAGLFKGLQVELNSGKSWNFFGGKKKQIKAMLGK